MFSFTYVWPYMGLGAALLLALLLCTDTLRSDLTVSRWRDIVWLAWAGTLAYLVHQFEEHGVDLLGATYAFRGELCRNLGFPDIQTCPVPFSFITAVNISLVWLFGPTDGAARPTPAGVRARLLLRPLRQHPGITSSRQRFRAPTMRGVLTAVVFFLPLSLWAFHVALSRYRLGWRAVIATIAAGIVFHAIMIGSLARLPRRAASACSCST